MLRETAFGDKYWLAVTSKGRPFRVEPQTALIGDATWYVPEGEGQAYTAAGAPSARERDPVTGRGPAGGRNLAMDEAFEKDLPLLILDDDILWFKLCYPRKGIDLANTRLRVSFAELTAVFFRRAASYPQVKLFTPRPGNQYPWNRSAANSTTCSGSFLLILPTHLRMASFEELPVTEDVDYAYQHMREYGAWMKFLDIRHEHKFLGLDEYKKLPPLDGGLADEYSRLGEDPLMWARITETIRKRHPELPSWTKTESTKHKVSRNELDNLGGGFAIRKRLGGMIPYSQLREELALLPPEYTQLVADRNGGFMFQPDGSWSVHE